MKIRKELIVKKTTKQVIRTTNCAKKRKRTCCKMGRGEKEASTPSRIFPAVQWVIAVLTFLYPIVKYAFNRKYGVQCENYYNIPAKYFYKSIDSSLLFIGLIVLMLSIPLFYKWLINKLGTDKTWSRIGVGLISLTYGLALGCVNFLNLIEICSQSGGVFWQWIYLQLSRYPCQVAGIVVMAAICFTAGWSILPLLKEVKKTAVQAVFAAALSMITVLNLFILFRGTSCVLNSNPELNTEYEIAEYMGTEYVVMSEYNDKVLVVSILKDDEGKISLDTGSYRFLDPIECEFYYYDFGYAPTIISSEGLDSIS